MQLEKKMSNFKNVCFYINFVFLIVGFFLIGKSISITSTCTCRCICYVR